MTIAGIDNASLYAVEPDPDIWNAPYNYLYSIALAEMSDAASKAPGKSWSTRKIFRKPSITPSTRRLDAAAAPAPGRSDGLGRRLAVDYPAGPGQKRRIEGAHLDEDAGNLKALQDYLNVVMQRSDAMAANLLKLSQANPGRPVPAVVGLMHAQRIQEKLHAAGVTLVEIRYNSQVPGRAAGAIQNEAYHRMDKGQSVQGAGTLAAILDGRRKPAPAPTSPGISARC